MSEGSDMQTTGTDLVVSFERDGGLITVRMHGPFTRATAAGFEAQLDPVATGRRREFSMDVSGVTEVDEAFVATLLRIRTEHGHIALVNPTAEIRAAVDAAGAEHVLVLRSRVD